MELLADRDPRGSQLLDPSSAANDGPGAPCEYPLTAREPDEALVTDPRAGIAGATRDLRIRHPRHDLSRARRIDYRAGLRAGGRAGHRYSHDAARRRGIHESVEPVHAISIYDRYWLVIERSLSSADFAAATQYESRKRSAREQTQQMLSVGRAHFGAGRLHLLKGGWIAGALTIRTPDCGVRTGTLASAFRTRCRSAGSSAQVGEASEALTRSAEGQRAPRAPGGAGFRSRDGDYQHWVVPPLLARPTRRGAEPGDRASVILRHTLGTAAHALHLLGDIATQPDRFDARERRGPLPARRCARQAARHASARRPLPPSGSANFTGARASGSRRRSTSPPRRRCTARWTCSSAGARRRWS